MGSRFTSKDLADLRKHFRKQRRDYSSFKTLIFFVLLFVFGWICGRALVRFRVVDPGTTLEATERE